jgi:alkylation response protein AidB-like acyl-CoA dehydrogenase
MGLAQVEAARTLAAALAAGTAEAERERHLPDAVVRALVAQGMFRMLVPRSIGGGEAEPATFVATVEELARADASAAWCIAACGTAGMVAAYLPEDAAGELFGPADSIAGGAFAPKGRAVPVDGGYRVTGRWPFASGVDHCHTLMGGCFVLEDGVPRMVAEGRPDIRLALVPASEVEVIDTWHVSGLRGTGSKDMVIDDVPVPDAYTASLLTQRPREPGPLYTFPIFGLLALSIAGVALGIARAALDTLVELSGAKTPTMSGRKLAERPGTQAQVARAEATLRAARALLYDEIARAWDVAQGAGEVPVPGRSALRLAATHATAAAATTVDAAYDLGGGTSIYETSPLQRHFRDVHAATQHMLVGPATWELAGRVLLGLPTEADQL